MRECLDEGILQSYFDGELSSAHMEGVTSHLVSCMKCAAAARELEGEFLLLSSALASEFDAAVPTERLRHRIDVAVAACSWTIRMLLETPGYARPWLASISQHSVCVYTQRTFAYAALAVMLVLERYWESFSCDSLPPSTTRQYSCSAATHSNRVA